jgi:hypothetical protein
MSQNLLSNVFKPTYVYDTTSQTYSSRLELVNIDIISANVVTAFMGSIGDAYGNVYVGINAGNSYSNRLDNSNVTALGANAGQGSSNCSNAIFIGYGAGTGSTSSKNTIAIGFNTLASGTGNIYIGTGTGSVSGTSNTFIGQGIAPVGTTTNTLLMGNGTTTTITDVTLQTGILISGVTNGVAVYVPGLDGNRYLYSCNAVGINTTTPTYTLDVNGYSRIGTNQNGGLGINTNPYDYTLNVNGDMQVSDGYGVFRFTHDGNCNSATTIDVTGTYSASNAVATLGVTGGFFSYRGTLPATGSPVTIGTLKPGMVTITVTTTTGGASEAFLLLANTTTEYLTIKKVGDIMIDVDGSGNINISNADYTMSWVITYFPSLPI